MSKRRKIKISKSQLPTFRSFVVYAGVFSIFASAIGYSYHSSDSNAASPISVAEASAIQHDSSVDDATALHVAGDIALRANLPIAANITNRSTSLYIENAISRDGARVVAKPQINQQSAEKYSVESYIVKGGDTPQSIADKFHVTAQTIKWANKLDTDTLETDSALLIPPVDGVLYTVKDGDTVESIATKYKSELQQVITFNDLELSGVEVSQRIILPGGELPTDERPGYVAPARDASSSSSSRANSAASVSLLVGGYSPITMTAGGNAYAFGNCTSWAYERRVQLGHPVGSYWGNGATWDSSARAAGYTVDKNPTVGSVYQMPAFVDAYTGIYGHVGIVESVNPDGSIYVSEMNYAGNFNLVTYRTIPAAQAALYNYIH